MDHKDFHDILSKEYGHKSCIHLLDNCYAMMYNLKIT